MVENIASIIRAVDYDIHREAVDRLIKTLSHSDKNLNSAIYTRMLGESKGYLVKLGSGPIIGMAWLYMHLIPNYGGSWAGYIENVVIDADYQGFGFGRQIVQAIVNDAKYLGCYKVELNCSDDNIPFYEKCGFRYHENCMRIDL